MTFTIPRKALAEELAALQSVAERKTTMPILEYVMLGLVGDTLTLTASSIDISLITEIKAEGEAWGGCVPCKQLYQLVKLFSGETVSFKPKDNEISVRSERAKHRLPLAKASEFPEIEQADSERVGVPAETFAEMLNSVAFAVLQASDSLSNSQQRFTGVNLIVRDGRLSLTGTNITRLANASCAVESPLAIDVIIPGDALPALRMLTTGTVEIGLTGTLIYFVNGQRRLYVRRLHDDKFPDWRAMFPQTFDHTAIIATEELSTAIRRAMLTQSVSEKRLVTLGLRWTWTNGELLIETKGNDRGKSDELLTIESPTLNGTSVAIGIDGQPVLDALPRMGERVTMKFSPASNTVQLLPDKSDVGFIYYVGTVTLRHWE